MTHAPGDRGPAHDFTCRLDWTGAAAGPVRSYAGYSREVSVRVDGKAALALSAAPPFRGDGALWNPEDLLVASLSACHFLSYAALCARHGVELRAYHDEAWGQLAWDEAARRLRFREVVLRPVATLAPGSDEALALRLHERAHEECFIAGSVAFPVRHEAVLRVEAG